jgi:hypothetical protein
VNRFQHVFADYRLIVNVTSTKSGGASQFWVCVKALLNNAAFARDEKYLVYNALAMAALA